MKPRYNLVVLIIAFLVSYSAAFVGSLFTADAVESDWYNVIKPSITPPTFVFPIVWNIIFFLIAVSLFIAWTRASKKSKLSIALVFAINLVLNVLWSVFYFGLRNPLASLIEIFFLAASIIIMMHVSYKVNKTSAYLLIPYFLWVCFAIVLNWLSVMNWLS